MAKKQGSPKRFQQKTAAQLNREAAIIREQQERADSRRGGLRPHASHPAGPGPAGPHPAGPGPAGPGPAGPRPAGPGPAGPRPAGPGPAGPRPAGPRPAGPRPAGPRPAGPRPAAPRPPQAAPSAAVDEVQPENEAVVAADGPEEPAVDSLAGRPVSGSAIANVAMQAGSSESLNSSGPATKRQKIVDKATSPFVAPKSFDPSSKNEEHTNQSHDLTRREGDVIVRIAPNESSDNPSVPPPYIYLNGVRYRWAPVAVENGHDSTESTGELSRAPVMETTNSIGDGVSPAIVSQDDGRRSSASSVVTAEEPSAVSTQAPPTQASNTSELVSPTYGYTNISVVQVSFTSNESRAANSEPSINSSTAISYDVTQRSDRPTQVSSISIERELNISEVNGEVSNLTGTPSFVAQSSGWPSQVSSLVSTYFRTPTSPLLLSTPADQSQPIPCDLTVENDVSPDHIGHVSVDHGSDGLAGEPADVSSAGRPSLLSITTDNDAPISPLVTFTPIESLDIVSHLLHNRNIEPPRDPNLPKPMPTFTAFSSQEPVHFTVMHNRENREEIGTDIAELRSPGPRRASPLNPTFGMSPTSQDNLHSVRIPFPSPVASNEPETVAENDTAEADPVTADSVDLEAGNSKD